MANKYKHLQTPQAEFDFHGYGPLTHGQILDLADDFIQDCLASGYRLVSIITGVGLHSKNGPVVKPLIADFLVNHPDVQSFSEAKFTQGGQGVFIIKLKK
jgi:DNA-nicking Smr family endonuclease